MKKKLAFLIAAILVCATLLGTPPPMQADFCETMYGCRVKRSVGMAECICDSSTALRTCAICCIDYFGCCWIGDGQTSCIP
jgi:hypothetical protein